MDAESISMGSSSGHRMQHRRRSSTSDTSKFREKLQLLSHSVEMQEHLVTESPREKEQEEGSGSSEEEEEVEEEELCDISGMKIKPAPRDHQGTTVSGNREDNSNTNNNRYVRFIGQDGGSPSAGKKRRKGTLNLPDIDDGDDGTGAGDDRKSTAADMAVSVLNVGFDL